MRGGSSLPMSKIAILPALKWDLTNRPSETVLLVLSFWLLPIALIRLRATRILQSGCLRELRINANMFVLGCRSSITTA